jgi:hypothetical protein
MTGRLGTESLRFRKAESALPRNMEPRNDAIPLFVVDVTDD